VLFQSVSAHVPEWLVGLDTGTEKLLKDKVVNGESVLGEEVCYNFASLACILKQWRRYDCSLKLYCVYKEETVKILV